MANDKARDYLTFKEAEEILSKENNDDINRIKESKKDFIETKIRMIGHLVQRMVEIEYILQEAKAEESKELRDIMLQLKLEYSRKETEIIQKRAAKRKVLEKELLEAEEAIRPLAEHHYWNKLKREELAKFRVSKGKPEDKRRYNRPVSPYRKPDAKARIPKPKNDKNGAPPQGL